MNSNRIFYFGMVNTFGYCEKRRLDLYVGAAYVKIIGILSALREVGSNACLVTLPILNGSKMNFYERSSLNKIKNIPVIYLFSFRYRLLRKISGLIGFTYISIFKIKKKDKVIIYNYGLEYILALFVLKYRGIKTYQDIEDLPLSNIKSLRDLIINFEFFFVKIFTENKKIVAASKIAKKLDLKEYLPIYGVSAELVNIDFTSLKWKSIVNKGDLNLHYGGTIINETGSELFISAMKILARMLNNDTAKLNFYLSGIGELEMIKEGIKLIDCPYIKFEVYKSLQRKEYLKLINKCHGSMALKISQSDLSSTTFPSKVIEITTNGIALITTPVSDLPILFDDTNVFYLKEETPEFLANILYQIALNPKIIMNKAIAGYEFSKDKFSKKNVGTILSKFLELKD